MEEETTACFPVRHHLCFALSSKEGDPVIAEGAGDAVGSAHREMPGKLSAQRGTARWEKINDAVPKGKPGTQKETGRQTSFHWAYISISGETHREGVLPESRKYSSCMFNYSKQASATAIVQFLTC